MFFGEYLIKQGLIQDADLVSGLIEQVKNQKTSAEACLELDILDSEKILSIFAHQNQSGDSFLVSAKKLSLLSDLDSKQIQDYVFKNRKTIGEILVELKKIDSNQLVQCLDNFFAENLSNNKAESTPSPSFEEVAVTGSVDEAQSQSSPVPNDDHNVSTDSAPTTASEDVSAKQEEAIAQDADIPLTQLIQDDFLPKLRNLRTDVESQNEKTVESLEKVYDEYHRFLGLVSLYEREDLKSFLSQVDSYLSSQIKIYKDEKDEKIFDETIAMNIQIIETFDQYLLSLQIEEDFPDAKNEILTTFAESHFNGGQ